MINNEDVESLNKLLHLVKSSNEYTDVDISYNSHEGWRVSVYPPYLSVNQTYGNDGAFKKERLGKLCQAKIAQLVQMKLGG